MNEVFKTSWEAKYNVTLDKHFKNLDTFDDVINSEFKLLQFMKDFCSRATDTCKLIIDELSRPVHERTHKATQITPVEQDPEIPEIAFILNNCIIRMTWSTGGLEEIPDVGEYYLYNGKILKAYGHGIVKLYCFNKLIEFRAMNLLNDHTYIINRKYNNVFLRVPLSMIIDYKGFRCLIISSPPLNGDETLFIGPSITEGSYKANKNIEEDLRYIAKNINVKEHKFILEEKGITIDVPLSILMEVHKTSIDVTDVEICDSNTSYTLQENDKDSIEKKEMTCFYIMNTSEVIPVDIDVDAPGPASFLKRLR